MPEHDSDEKHTARHSLGSNAKPRRFLPAYGRASFLLAVFAFFWLFVVGFAIENVQIAAAPNTLDAEQTGFLRTIAVISVAASAIAFGAAAAVFGLLSLLGFGKVQGTSRPGLGCFGIVLGGAIALIPLLLFPVHRAVSRAPQAAVQRAREAEPKADHGMSNAGIQLTARHLALDPPGDGWKLFEGDAARGFNPEAEAVGAKKLNDTEALVAVVTFADVDLEEYTNPVDLRAAAQRLIESVGWQDLILEHVENGQLCELQTGIASATGRAPNGTENRVRYVVFGWRGQLVGILLAGPTTQTDSKGTAFKPFMDSIRLLDP